MRYFVDVMTGVPSIVFGLFIYIVLILGGVGGGFAGWKGSVALALLMLPVVTRAAEVVLHARAELAARGRARAGRAALARRRCGSCCRPRCPGWSPASLLAIARAAGETAPLLFTAAAVKATTSTSASG